jgi:toxin FitB
MFLVDTNVISALRRPDKTSPKVVAWSENVHQAELYLSVVTIFEIEVGLLRKEHQNDHQQAAILRRWTDQIRRSFAGRILPVDMDVALRCARLHIPDPRSERDALIAATALVHDLTVVTGNVKDFSGMGVALLNPWND